MKRFIFMRCSVTIIDEYISQPEILAGLIEAAAVKSRLETWELMDDLEQAIKDVKLKHA